YDFPFSQSLAHPARSGLRARVGSNPSGASFRRPGCVRRIPPLPAGMNLARTVGRQLTRLVAGNVLGRVLDLGLYLLLARALGVEAFGRYTFALSFTLLFNALADLGISTVFTREVARHPARARELLRPCLAMKLALGALTIPAVTLAARFGPAGRESLALVLPIVAGMLLNSTAMLFDGLLRAAGRPGRSGLNVMLPSIAALITGCTLLGLGSGPLAGAYAYLAGRMLRLLSAAWWWRGLLR